MADSLRGMPLLSGPPPPRFDPSARSEISCRKCNKEFNILFTRSKKCGHCGYSYCSSCADYQALMPRSGADTGYDPMPVCAFCIEFLTLTAGGKGHLRQQPIAKLKRYVQAYNISLGSDVIEKDDVVDAIIAARAPNGCLPAANEDYYRKHSVPSGQTAKPRGIFTRNTGQARPIVPSTSDGSGSWPRSQDSRGFARYDLETPEQIPGQSSARANNTNQNVSSPSSDHRYSQPPPSFSSPHVHQQRHRPPSYTPPLRRSPSSSQPSTAPRQSQPPYAYPQYSAPRHSPYQTPQGSRSSHNLHVPPSNIPPRPATATPQRPRTTSAAGSPHAPAPPVPSLEELLRLPQDDISHFNVGTLKSILFQNHVNARMVLEKSDLVSRVMTLLDHERRERARAREQEEQEAIERQRRMMEEHRMKEEQKRSQQENNLKDNASIPTSPSEDVKATGSETRASKLSPEAQAKVSALERNGLCVVCQDEEANIAIVDCGHLALCRSCSDLIMTSSRECPLCRTRIVTEARLLRIFKT